MSLGAYRGSAHTAKTSVLQQTVRSSGRVVAVGLAIPLSDIAEQFYGSANDWQKIFSANRHQIVNPDVNSSQVLAASPERSVASTGTPQTATQQHRSGGRPLWLPTQSPPGR